MKTRVLNKDARQVAATDLCQYIVARLRRNYRTCINGTDSCKIGKVVGIAQTSVTDWNLYRGQFKGWAATITNNYLTVREDYYKAGHREGPCLEGLANPGRKGCPR